MTGRLIEADAVYKILESCEIKKDTYGSLLNDWDHGYNCGIERAESEIECAPTVEAIPISWLQTKADSWNAELKNACPEDAETIRHIQDKYLEIIEEWRKEE